MTCLFDVRMPSVRSRGACGGEPDRLGLLRIEELELTDPYGCPN